MWWELARNCGNIHATILVVSKYNNVLKKKTSLFIWMKMQETCFVKYEHENESLFFPLIFFRDSYKRKFILWAYCF